NSPITSLIIGFEMFGFDSMRFLLIGVAISYMLSGYTGLYSEQTIVYSKFKTQFINRNTK
ncbi:MAG: chloride channel protein, partial [Clostridia bacterium]|nr:chloride channel protein [Clostridia bacterium]